MVSFQIPNTENQSQSEVWFAQRWPRITASICKKVVQLGENLDATKCFSWLSNNFWFKTPFTSFDMQYGIDEEPNAIAAYSELTGTEVCSSGLWLNKKYPYLGASPDGLIFNSEGKLRGIIEVKCLKALRDKTVEDWINAAEIPSYSCVFLANFI